ncbi:MAG: electron transfer flavoprotein subunit beta/FixA family protein [Planctomycetota bacterium]|jgi:electron transfer flavoprotein beta subunit
MRILTLAIQVPDSRSPISVEQDGSGIKKEGVKFVCNPFDEFAVEQAVQLKEGRSDVEEIVALTIGPADAAGTLRTALAMGADRAIHVVDEAPLRDELALAEMLAAAIGRDEQSFDLILCGKQTIDRDAGELGPALAELLGWPHVGAITKLEVADDGSTVRVHRRIEGAEEIAEASLPVLLTCEKGLVEPRYPALPKLIQAKKKPLDTVAAADLPGVGALADGMTLVKLEPPPPRPACTMVDGEPPQMARELVRLLREEAKVI